MNSSGALNGFYSGERAPGSNFGIPNIEPGDHELSTDRGRTGKPGSNFELISGTRVVQVSTKCRQV